MIRNQHTRWISIVFSCGCVAAILPAVSSAFAQDSQQAASARVAREKIAAKETANSSPTVKDSATTDDSSTAEQAEKLGRRAGEQTGDGPRGRSLVLGMNLQEVGNGGVKVVEVAASSPAFDAGIHKGDVLVSFENFQADSYRKWIDGIGRLTSDAPAGAMVPVVVVRDGKPMTLQIRVPESSVANVQLPVGPPPQNPLQQVQSGPQVPAGATGGDNDVLINNGPFGNFFNDEASPATERAMAQLFRVGGGPPAAQGGANPAPIGNVAGGTRAGAAGNGNNVVGGGAANGAAPANRGARIGLAGFRNDANGMLVMIDVGGLQPGNYSVGITDPSVIERQTAPGIPSPPNLQAPGNGSTQPGQPQLPVPGHRGARRQTPDGRSGAAPAGQPPNTPPPGVGQPQSNLQPAAPREIPKTVLAQVSDNGQSAGTPGSTIPPTGQVRPLTTPPTGQVNPLTAPATGQVNPSSTTPTGQSTVNNALTNQINRSNAAGTGNTPMPNVIGTLTVDQSGTGRMQHVVEGVQVRNVVGQAIVIYSQAGGAQTTLPPNLDPTADPAGGQSSAAGVPQTAQVAGRGGSTTGSTMPVAAGIIRLISDRRPSTSGDGAPDDAFGPPPINGVQPAGAQPTNNTPPIPPNPNR